MLKNYWYAVEFGHAVTDTPVQARVFDQDLVLFRNSRGEVVCHSDICIHRGGSLAGGKIHGDCIACPYHGWQFAEDGACVKIPANREGLPIPKKARVDTYPVVERYGYVFVFLGDLPEHERPPMPELPLMAPLPEAHAAGNRIIQGEFAWNANYERVLENGVDAAHAPFVHSTSFGNPDKPVIEDFELHETASGEHLTSAVYTVHLDAPEPKGIWKIIGKKGDDRPPIETGNGLFFPNVTFLAGEAAARHHDALHRGRAGGRDALHLQVDHVPRLLHQAVAGGAPAGRQGLVQAHDEDLLRGPAHGGGPAPRADPRRPLVGAAGQERRRVSWPTDGGAWQRSTGVGGSTSTWSDCGPATRAHESSRHRPVASIPNWPTPGCSRRWKRARRNATAQRQRRAHPRRQRGDRTHEPVRRAVPGNGRCHRRSPGAGRGAGGRDAPSAWC